MKRIGAVLVYVLEIIDVAIFAAIVIPLMLHMLEIAL
jgi:hypothetical protein